MNHVIQASELLNRATQDARTELDADPGNILLAMRLSRLQVLSSLCQTFGLGADIASGYVPVSFAPAGGMDAQSGGSNELAGSSGSCSAFGACASERRPVDPDELPSGCRQLSLDLESG